MFVFLILSVFLAGFSPQTVRNRILQPSPTAIFSITEVLQRHALWLSSNGKDGARADLRGMNLEAPVGGYGEVLVGRVVLAGVDLRQADLRETKLRNIDFTGADLQDVRFDRSNLRWGVLANADLRRANFTGANLQSADLKGADLDQVNFTATDLTGTDLTGARCVTRMQLGTAIVDDQTKLPAFQDCAPQRN
jgi:uncharacterized protein YjbI with pentapeptide repeats